MKAICEYVLLIMLCPAVAFAQLSGPVKQGHFSRDSMADPNLIYVIKLNDSKEIVTHSFVFKEEDIKTIVQMSAAEKEKRFGNVDIYRITGLMITLTPNVKFKRLSEVYQEHHLNGEESTRILKIDGKIIKDTTNVLFSENAIKTFDVYADSVIVFSEVYEKMHNVIRKNRKN